MTQGCLLCPHDTVQVTTYFGQEYPRSAVSSAHHVTRLSICRIVGDTHFSIWVSGGCGCFYCSVYNSLVVYGIRFFPEWTITVLPNGVFAPSTPPPLSWDSAVRQTFYVFVAVRGDAARHACTASVQDGMGGLSPAALVSWAVLLSLVVPHPRH